MVVHTGSISLGADKRKEIRVEVNLTVCCCIQNSDETVTITAGKLIDVNSKAVKMTLPFIPEMNALIYIYPKLQYNELLFKEMPLCVRFLRPKASSGKGTDNSVDVVCICDDDKINVKEKVMHWVATYR